MTDKYPPFRLELGGAEPGGRFSVPPPGPVPGTAITSAPAFSTLRHLQANSSTAKAARD